MKNSKRTGIQTELRFWALIDIGRLKMSPLSTKSFNLKNIMRIVSVIKTFLFNWFLWELESNWKLTFESDAAEEVQTNDPLHHKSEKNRSTTFKWSSLSVAKCLTDQVVFRREGVKPVKYEVRTCRSVKEFIPLPMTGWGWHTDVQKDGLIQFTDLLIASKCIQLFDTILCSKFT